MIPSNYPPDYDPRIDSGEDELTEEELLEQSAEYDETDEDKDQSFCFCENPKPTCQEPFLGTPAYSN